MYKVVDTFFDKTGETESHRVRLSNDAIEKFERIHRSYVAYLRWMVTQNGAIPFVTDFAPRRYLNIPTKDNVHLFELPDGGIPNANFHSTTGMELCLSQILPNSTLRRALLGDLEECLQSKEPYYFHCDEVDEGQAHHFSRLMLPFRGYSDAPASVLVMENSRVNIVVPSAC